MVWLADHSSWLLRRQQECHVSCVGMASRGRGAFTGAAQLEDQEKVTTERGSFSVPEGTSCHHTGWLRRKRTAVAVILSYRRTSRDPIQRKTVRKMCEAVGFFKVEERCWKTGFNNITKKLFLSPDQIWIDTKPSWTRGNQPDWPSTADGWSCLQFTAFYISSCE